MLGPERLQQKLPVRRRARRSVVADEREIAIPILVVGGGEHVSALVEPLDTRRAVQRLAALGPAGRVCAAEAVHDLVHRGERKIGRKELASKDDRVDVVKEMQVDVRNAAGYRLPSFVECDAQRADIGATVDPQRGVSPPQPTDRTRSIAVKKALHVRQEAHEFAIVPFLEYALNAELVIDEIPMAIGQSFELGVGRLATAIFLGPQDLDWPQDDLTKVARNAWLRFRAWNGIPGGWRRFGVIHAHTPVAIEPLGLRSRDSCEIAAV